jgi:hypothetical protein
MDLMDWDCIDSSLFMDLLLDLHLFMLLDVVVSWLTSSSQNNFLRTLRISVHTCLFKVFVL